MTKSTRELLIGAGVVAVGGFAVYELFIKPKAATATTAAPAGTTTAVTVTIPSAPTPPTSK